MNVEITISLKTTKANIYMTGNRKAESYDIHTTYAIYMYKALGFNIVPGKGNS